MSRVCRRPGRLQPCGACGRALLQAEATPRDRDTPEAAHVRSTDLALVSGRARLAPGEAVSSSCGAGGFSPRAICRSKRPAGARTSDPVDEEGSSERKLCARECRATETIRLTPLNIVSSITKPTP